MNSPGRQVREVLLEESEETPPEKNEEAESKQKQRPVVDVTGGGSKSDAVKSNITQEPGMLGP